MTTQNQSDYDAGEYGEQLIKLFADEIKYWKGKRLMFMEMRLDGQQVSVLGSYREDRKGNISGFYPIATLLTPEEIQRLRNFDGSTKGMELGLRRG